MRLGILGASGHGKVVADTALQSGWDEVVFFDDAWPDLKSNGCWTVIGNSYQLFEAVHEFEGVFVGIGNNEIRMRKLTELLELGARVPSIVHPNALISEYAHVECGSAIFAGSVIQAGSILGKGCIINTHASVDHDCILGDGVHVSPGAALAGKIEVGSLSWIGIGAVVKPLIRIGKRAIVGAGAAVVSDVDDQLTVVGTPARPIATKKSVLES